MLKRALLFKVVSWIILSPALAQAEQLHCRADVREAMNRAWIDVQDGKSNFEAIFLIRANGSIDYRGNLHQYMRATVGKPAPGTIAVFHTHPDEGIAKLSATDKNFADVNGLVVYAITSQGLFKYSHPMGESIVRPDMEWAHECK